MFSPTLTDEADSGDAEGMGPGHTGLVSAMEVPGQGILSTDSGPVVLVRRYAIGEILVNNLLSQANFILTVIEHTLGLNSMRSIIRQYCVARTILPNKNTSHRRLISG